jgi:hypothetical protein
LVKKKQLQVHSGRIKDEYIRKYHANTQKRFTEASKTMSKDDNAQLVEWLSLKNNEVRYQAFLLLQNRSDMFHDVYPFWDTFRDKLNSDNSYQKKHRTYTIAKCQWDSQTECEYHRTHIDAA